MTLVRVGELGGGSHLLLSGIAALREALEVRTCECVTVDWATTQDSLGTAFARLEEVHQGISIHSEGSHTSKESHALGADPKQSWIVTL